ncbi:hypothetical protein SAMD00019534_090230 [Acytostelium subglobosum LB1]|uniref:hypothetical protein n=1 Tax=Acytostelium subglobosum LB1 TaxID=1410327 RepID=UPI0006449169|nr:hypothetical protein SAMD00019534_090230 [Acytostelium subglobosum LB1]GAM25848.1 hypothetical protein SAMD00019534_090230 [Acytostelium subglobosum LB1]|eukprot:XP_012751366.1 hypothetical protein SAMD00019534_090230 [Acytostelium subglobosum LB1]
MVYITAHPVSDPYELASAIHCTLRGDTNAPLTAMINYVPSAFAALSNMVDNNEYHEQWRTYQSVSLHEMTHALGFNAYLAPYFESVTLERPAIITKNHEFVNSKGKHYKVNKQYIQTPNVLAYVKDHFGCDAMPGAELEDIGGLGTAGNHWKAAVFGEELMLGYSQGYAPITGLTLALLKDTGWYTVHESKDVKPLVFGLKKGCDFALKPCSDTTWGFDGYWEITNSKPGCSATRSGVGLSQVWVYPTVLPTQYQHFEDGTWGAQNGPVFDYCLFNSPEVVDNSGSSYYCLDTSRKPNQYGTNLSSTEMRQYSSTIQS